MGATERTEWDDLQLEQDPARPGRYTTTISDRWMLFVVPQGGIVAALAARAMELELGDPTQTLRTISAVFAGQVGLGPVEIDVQVLRRGRSMSQLTASVRNVGAAAGLTAIAAFGAQRRGFAFTELAFPEVKRPEGLRGFRSPLPEGVGEEFARRPSGLWDEVVDCRPAIGRPPWEPFVDGPAECANWYRLDRPPRLADGRLDPLAVVVLCDSMPGSVGTKVGPQDEPWFSPSVDLTVHLCGEARSEWLLLHCRAHHAGDGYASGEAALWDPEGPDGPELVAWATQVMFFTFSF